MIIETKYNIGDEVWCLIVGIPIPVIVFGIRVVYDKYHKSIRYNLREKIDGDITISLSESVLFPTKDELLKSL